MDEYGIRARLEDIGLSDDQIEEVLPLVTPEPVAKSDGLVGVTEKSRIYEQLSYETDWRIRAALAARLISMSLD